MVDESGGQPRAAALIYLALAVAAPPFPARPPRRFQRRLLAVLVAAGLLPLVGWGLAGQRLLSGALSIAAPIGPLLERAAGRLEASESDGALVRELREAELHLAQADLARRRLLVSAPQSFLIALAGSAILLAAAAWLLGRRLSRPVETLAEGIARFARGDLAHLIPERTGRPDELDYLAAALNRMARELRAQRERLQETEKIAAWRDVARAMAHDLKNPLTAMRMALGRLAKPDRSATAVTEAVALLQEEVDVLLRMTGSFSELARLPEPVRRPVALAGLLEEVCALYAQMSPAVRIVCAPGLRPTVEGDADQLRRALGNLVKNAIEAGGAVIEVAIEPGADSGHVNVLIRDDGAGIGAVREGPVLMAGLGSSKGAGRGIGLPVAHTIVHAQGGRLRLQPRDPRGTEAQIELRVAQEGT